MKGWWLIGLIWLAGCATTPALKQQAKHLSVGMTKYDVLTQLGQPNTKMGKAGRETWYYWKREGGVIDDPFFVDEQDRLTVTFSNERLESWGDEFDFLGDWANRRARDLLDTAYPPPTPQPSESP